MEFPKTLNIENIEFEFFQEAREATSAIYRSLDRRYFLKIGKPEKIKRDTDKHKKLFDMGYPISKLISTGEKDGFGYAVEESLGENLLADIFRKDRTETGKIREENFEKILFFSKKLLRAQLANTVVGDNWDSFLKGILIDDLYLELPHLKEKTEAILKQIRERFKNIPYVWAHGDFNPYNILENGVIDFEDATLAPAIFDVFGFLVYDDWFPHDENLEVQGGYHYSKDQMNLLFVEVDKILKEYSFPSAKDLFEDIYFLKGVWLTVKLHRVPNFQRRRYEMFENLIKPSVYLLCGLPGSGKTTFAKSRENNFTTRISLDEEFLKKYGENFDKSKHDKYSEELEEELLSKSKKVVLEGKSVILDFGFWKKEKRDKYKDEFSGIADVRLVFFDVSKEVRFERVLRRDLKNNHDLDKIALEKFEDMFEKPENENVFSRVDS